MNPVLVVDDPYWMAGPRCLVRVNGPLPTVTNWAITEYDEIRVGSYPSGTRPLRAGDRVILATDDCECRSCMYGNHPHPFATATVTKVHQVVYDSEHPAWYVTVTGVEPLEES